MRGLLTSLIIGGVLTGVVGTKGLNSKEIAERTARKELSTVLLPMRVVDNASDGWRALKLLAKQPSSKVAGIVSRKPKTFPTSYEKSMWESGRPCKWRKSSGLCGGY